MPVLFENTEPEAEEAVKTNTPEPPSFQPTYTNTPVLKPQTVEDQPAPEKTKTPTEFDNRLGAPDTHPKTRLLGAYVTRPKSFYFTTQERNEYVVLYLRQHPITQLGWVLIVFFLIIGSPFVFNALSIFVPITLPDTYKLIILIFWFLILATVIFTKFLLWYYNINIVSNKRIVDIDIPYLLTQEISSCLIDQVEEVTYKKFGLLSALFDYGDVYVQTAGSTIDIEFLKVPDPKLVVKTILYLKDQLQNE
jgi:hypothetical protein